MVSMVTLERMLSPIQIGDFYKSYWGKKRLYVPGESRKFSYLFDRKKFKQFLERTLVFIQPPEIRLVKNGELVDEKNFMVYSHYYVKCSYPKRSVSVDKVAKLISNGASLVLSDIQEYQDEIKTFSYELSRELNEQVHCTCYFTADDQITFSPHVDEDDFFYLQLDGKKKWLFYEFRNENLELVEEIVLNKGDLIYVPSGVFHTAKSVGSFSLALNVSIKIQRFIDLAETLVRDILLPKLFASSNLLNKLPAKTMFHAKNVPADQKMIVEKIKTELIEYVGHLTIADLNEIMYKPVQIISKKKDNNDRFSFVG